MQDLNSLFDGVMFVDSFRVKQFFYEILLGRQTNRQSHFVWSVSLRQDNFSILQSLRLVNNGDHSHNCQFLSD